MKVSIKQLSYMNILLLLFYPLAIIPKQFFFIISILVIFLLLLKQPLKNNKYFFLVVILFCLHIFATFLFIFTNDTTLTRVIASFNTALSWIIAGIMLCFTPKNKELSSSINRKISFFNIIFVVGLSFLALLLQRINKNFSIFGNPLYADDWVSSGRESRLILFFDYASLITFFVIINLGFYLNNKINFKDLCVILICFVPVYFSKSRICIVAYLLFLMFYIIRYIKEKLVNYKIILFSFIVVLLGGMLVFSSKLNNYISNFISMRGNSNNARFDLYLKSVLFTFNNNLLFGSGVKIDYAFNVPYGSHSTFIGLFYKFGLFGLIIGMYLYFSIFKSSLLSKNKTFFISLISLTIIMLLEDIDGTNWLVFYTFLLLSSYIRYKEGNKFSLSCV